MFQQVGSLVVAHGLSCLAACGILVLPPGIERASSGRQILNHWTARKVSTWLVLVNNFCVWVQDELAIASFLMDMGDYLRGGECPYPLWEAVEDARFWLELEKLRK